MNKSNTKNDEIKKRIASLKEELDKKKAKLKRSLEKKQTFVTPKRVRFSDTNLVDVQDSKIHETHSGLESYLLSQNLFDDTLEEGDSSTNSMFSVSVPCGFLPTRCSVLTGDRGLVSLLCDDAVCVKQSGDITSTVFSRRTKSSRFLLADLCRTSGGMGLMLCELKRHHIIATWLSLDDEHSIRSVFTAAVLDWSHANYPETSIVWNSESSAALFFVTSTASSRMTTLVWNEAELVTAESRPIDYSFDHAFFVTEQHALAVCRKGKRLQLGLITLIDLSLRKIECWDDRRHLQHFQMVEKEPHLVFLVGVDGCQEWTIFLDSLNTRSWKFLRLRRISVRLETPIPKYLSACFGSTLLFLYKDAIHRLSIDWTQQTVEKSTHRLPQNVDWVFGSSNFFSWCSSGIVTILLMPQQ